MGDLSDSLLKAKIIFFKFSIDYRISHLNNVNKIYASVLLHAFSEYWRIRGWYEKL